MTRPASADEIEQRITAVQMSTKTTWSAFIPLHEWLRNRSSLYYNWHLNPYANVVHRLSAVLTVSVFLVKVIVFSLPFLGPGMILANSAIFEDTSQNDFLLGTSVNSEVTNESGGEVRLADFLLTKEKTISIDNTISSQIAVTRDPTVAVVSPDDNFVYVASTTTNPGTITKIDTRTTAVVSTMSSGGLTPYGIAVSPSGDKLYVTNYHGNSVGVIDVATGSVDQTIAMTNYPIGIAITPDGEYVYVVNNWPVPRVSVIATSTNTVVETISVPAGPNKIVISHDGLFAYVASTNSVSVIDIATNQVIHTYAQGSTISNIALSQNDDYIYITNNGTDNLIVLNASNGEVVGDVFIGDDPYGIAVHPSENKLYVADTEFNLSIVDSEQLVVLETKAISGFPRLIDISHSGDRLYIPTFYNNLLHIYDTETNSLVTKPALTDYNLLIEFDSDNFDFTQTQDQGEDIRFYDEVTDSFLEYSIESWDSLLQQGSAIVKIPAIGEDSVKSIKMFFGNAEIADASTQLGQPGNEYLPVTVGAMAEGENYAYALSGEYLSRIVDVGARANFETLSWDASVTGATSMSVFLRSGLSEEEVVAKSWTDVYTTSGSSVSSSHAGSRFIQYKVLLGSSDPAQTPRLNNISIGYITSDSTQSTSLTENRQIFNSLPKLSFLVDDQGGQSLAVKLSYVPIADDASCATADWSQAQTSQSNLDSGWSTLESNVEGSISMSYTFSQNLLSGTYCWRVQSGILDYAFLDFGEPGATNEFVVDAVSPRSAQFSNLSDNGVYSLSTMPSQINGQVADDEAGQGLGSNSTTFYIKRLKDETYWDGSSWSTSISSLETSHNSTSGDEQVDWVGVDPSPTWQAGDYEFSMTVTDKAGYQKNSTPITITYSDPEPAVVTTEQPNIDSTQGAEEQPSETMDILPEVAVQNSPTLYQNISDTINKFLTATDKFADTTSAKVLGSTLVFANASTILATTALSYLLNFPFFSIIQQLYGLAIAVVNTLRPKRSWGVIRDSFTGKPISAVTVRVLDIKKQKIVGNTTTDLFGRYTLLLPPGKYELIAQIGVNNTLARNKVTVDVKETQIISENITLSTENKSQSQIFVFAKLLSALEKYRFPLLVVGSGITVLLLSFNASVYNVLALLSYLPIWLYEYRYKYYVAKSYIEIRDAVTRLPVDLVIVRLIDGLTGRLIATKVSARDGTLYLPLNKGVQRIHYRKEGYDEYTETIEQKRVALGRKKIYLTAKA